MSIPPPNSWRRQLLAEALELSRSLMKAENKAEDELIVKQQRLKQIRADLNEFAHPICRDCASVDQIPIAVRDAFVRASLLVTRYSQIGGQTWQGNLPSLTLSNFQPDPIPSVLNAPSALDRLCQMFALPHENKLAIAHTLEVTDLQIKRQKQIIKAVLASIESNENPDYLALFHHLFGHIPIPAAAINCVHTDTQIYFCVDYYEDHLCNSSLWSSLDAIEKSQVQEFLRSLNQFYFEQFQRFPIFGSWSIDSINQEWCDRISELTGFTATEVIQAIFRSVNIIPTSKVESLLVHDIWGHHWQLMLTQFESDYAILSTCGQPLSPEESAYTPNGLITCRELFKRDGHKVEIDMIKSRLFFHSEVQQRLGVLFTHLIGEIVADVAEFKFVWDNPQSADQLISTSIFKSEPTKLDLSLADIDFLFLKVLRPLLEFNLSVFSESELEQSLLKDWGDYSLELTTSLKQAIIHLYQIFLQEYNSTYLPTMTGEIGIFTQVVSNLLYLQNAIDSLYKDFIANSNPNLPFQDLLIIFIGNYSSSDSYAEFWEIDDVLADYFLPCWQILGTI